MREETNTANLRAANNAQTITEQNIILHGCKNSFIMIDEFYGEKINDKQSFVRQNAGKEDVDGVLFLSKSSDADLEMKIFDKDGTEESMCGNGIRCFVRYAFDRGYIQKRSKIMTGDGIKYAEVDKDLVEINMGKPREFVKIDQSKYFVFTGVPHLVYFQNNLDMDVSREIGRELRNDKRLCSFLHHPEGININFVKVISPTTIQIMTYEVGVEDITQACGTGSTAAAYVTHLAKGYKFPIEVCNPGGNIIIRKAGDNLMMKGPAEYRK